MTQTRRFQHGSLTKRGKRDKVWVARWWDEVQEPDGTFKRVRRAEIIGTVSEIRTKGDAERLMSERLRTVNSESSRRQRNWTLRSYIEDRWLPEVLPTVKRSTQNHYRYVANQHLIPELGDMQLRLITRHDVQDMLLRKHRSALSWRTVKHIRTTLGTVLGAAEIDELVDSNPVRKTKLPKRGPVAEKVPVDSAKLRALLDALPEPSRSIATLLAFGGLRIGEMLALRWMDVDFGKSMIRIRQSIYDGVFDEPKSQRSKRDVPLGPVGMQILRQRKPSNCAPDALVYATRQGTPLDRHNLLNRQLKPICEKLGMKGVTWHWFRHANATLQGQVGTPLATIQERLGHSSAEITREVYLHSATGESQKAAKAVEGLIGLKRTQVSVFGKLASTLTQ
jgi:integrase